MIPTTKTPLNISLRVQVCVLCTHPLHLCNLNNIVLCTDFLALWPRGEKESDILLPCDWLSGMFPACHRWLADSAPSFCSIVITDRGPQTRKLVRVDRGRQGQLDRKYNALFITLLITLFTMQKDRFYFDR